MLAREKFNGLHEWHNGSTHLQDAQKGRSARPQRADRLRLRSRLSEDETFFSALT